MSRTLTEQKILKKLKIEDFRHLSKDSVMRFASSIHKMDPEVAKKALEQFPNFSQAVKDGVVEYKEVVQNVIKSGDKDHDALLTMIDEEHKQLLKMLDDENLTLDEKFRIMDELRNLQDRVEKVNKDIRNYRLKMCGGFLAVVGIGACLLSSVLGSNTEISREDDDDDIN